MAAQILQFPAARISGVQRLVHHVARVFDPDRGRLFAAAVRAYAPHCEPACHRFADLLGATLRKGEDPRPTLRMAMASLGMSLCA